MKPQDVVVLLKISTYGDSTWQQVPLAETIKISQSEVSQSIARSKYAGLLDASGKRVMAETFLDFLQYGLAVVFPTKPGAMVRGIPTAHSAPPLSGLISTEDQFVWPFAKGPVRGRSITPLYENLPKAALEDEMLYTLLILCDALRVGKTREKNIAIKELRSRI